MLLVLTSLTESLCGSVSASRKCQPLLIGCNNVTHSRQEIYSLGVIYSRTTPTEMNKTICRIIHNLVSKSIVIWSWVYINCYCHYWSESLGKTETSFKKLKHRDIWEIKITKSTVILLFYKQIYNPPCASSENLSNSSRLKSWSHWELCHWLQGAWDFTQGIFRIVWFRMSIHILKTL